MSLTGKNERIRSQLKTWSHRHFNYCAKCIQLQQKFKFVGRKQVSNITNLRRKLEKNDGEEKNWRRTIRKAIEIKIHNSYMNRVVGRSTNNIHFSPKYAIALC